MSWTLTASGHVTPGDPAGPPQDSAAAEMELYEALKAILADPKYGTAASTFSGSHLQRQPRVRLAARGGRVGHGRGEADRGRAGVRPEAPATQPELGPRARRAGAPPAHRRWHHGGAGAHPGAACQRPEDHSCQAAHRSLVTPLTMALCYSCPYGQPKQPAIYRWTCALSGSTVPLCAECCAYWRMAARDEPDLAPSAICQIPPAA